jgi:hypothetical protein
MPSFLILSILISASGFISAFSFAKSNEAQTQNPFHFISEAEDIEKEAWWLVTGKRLSQEHSPWRLVYKAFLESKGLKSKQVISKLCQKLKVQGSPTHSIFTISTHCQSRPIEVATVKRLQAQKWEVQFQITQFIDHFGLGTSIFYQTLICELDLDERSKLQKMKCPVYARNRAVEEIVELKNFEYNKKGEPLMKIQGVIKKQFQDVARIETLIPSKGEIFIKEIKIPDPLDAVKVKELKTHPEQKQDPGLQEAPPRDEGASPAAEEIPPITPTR